MTPLNQTSFPMAIADIEFQAFSGQRTGLEPALGHPGLVPRSPSDESEDPSLAILRPGVWRAPLDGVPPEFIDEALGQARVVIVGDDGDYGAVLAYERGRMEAPVVLLPLVTDAEVERVRPVAQRLGVAVIVHEDLAWDPADLPLFAVLLEVMYANIAKVLVRIQRLEAGSG